MKISQGRVAPDDLRASDGRKIVGDCEQRNAVVIRCLNRFGNGGSVSGAAALNAGRNRSVL